jgi:hypothetical protein
MNEVAKCRRDHNRLGFAYQIGFARLFNRFPAQQPLEINDELLSFVALQTEECPLRRQTLGVQKLLTNVSERKTGSR